MEYLFKPSGIINVEFETAVKHFVEKFKTAKVFVVITDNEPTFTFAICSKNCGGNLTSFEEREDLFAHILSEFPGTIEAKA